ncbi:MAG: trans-sulfuration enzyme family protein, partial [Quisquiliibacterium sp.]
MGKRTDTLLQHGDRLPEDDSSVAPPIHPSATFRAGDAQQFAQMASRPMHARYYTRYGNPTLERTAQLIAQLEGGEAALLTASGMSAVSTTLIGLLSAGDHVVAQTSHYMGTSKLLGELLPRFGVRVTLVDQTSVQQFNDAIEPNTRLMMLETPVNPTLALTDLAAVCALARKGGVLSVVDNTFASPINQNPIALGADLVVHSATKYLGGHHDLTAGAIIGSPGVIERIWDSAIVLGGTLAPHDAWSLLRGMRTLAVRVERINASALRIARALEKMRGVARVHYPGLPSHPQHALACQQMRGFGAVIALQLDGG